MRQLSSVNFCNAVNILPRLRFEVCFCPTLPEDSDVAAFLQALGIDWRTAPANCTNDEHEEKIQKTLEHSPYRERGTERGRRSSGGGGRKAVEEENEEGLRINLKRVFQEEGLLGYDPTLGTCKGGFGNFAFVHLKLRVKVPGL